MSIDMPYSSAEPVFYSDQSDMQSPPRPGQGGAALSAANRRIKELEDENKKIRAELIDIQTLYKQVFNEGKNENYDERRVNLLKAQLIQMERQVMLLSDALSGRNDAMRELENAATGIANTCRRSLQQKDRIGSVSVKITDLKSMMEEAEGARVRLAKSVDSSVSSKCYNRRLAFHSPCIKQGSEPVSILSICSGSLEHINLKHVAKLESKLAQLYRRLHAINECLSSIIHKPQGNTSSSNSSASTDVPLAVYIRLGGHVSVAQDQLKEVLDDLLHLSVLVPSAPWPLLKRPINREIGVEQIMKKLPSSTPAKKQEMQKTIELLVKAHNYSTHMANMQLASTKEELTFHQSLYQLNIDHTIALMEALKEGYIQFEADYNSTICEPLKEILEKYNSLRKTSEPNILKCFLEAFRKHEPALLTAVQQMSNPACQAETNAVLSVFGESFLQSLELKRQECVKRRDLLLNQADKIGEQNKEHLEAMRDYFETITPQEEKNIIDELAEKKNPKKCTKKRVIAPPQAIEQVTPQLHAPPSSPPPSGLPDEEHHRPKAARSRNDLDQEKKEQTRKQWEHNADLSVDTYQPPMEALDQQQDRPSYKQPDRQINKQPHKHPDQHLNDEDLEKWNFNPKFSHHDLEPLRDPKSFHEIGKTMEHYEKLKRLRRRSGDSEGDNEALKSSAAAKKISPRNKPLKPKPEKFVSPPREKPRKGVPQSKLSLKKSKKEKKEQIKSHADMFASDTYAPYAHDQIIEEPNTVSRARSRRKEHFPALSQRSLTQDEGDMGRANQDRETMSAFARRQVSVEIDKTRKKIDDELNKIARVESENLTLKMKEINHSVSRSKSDDFDWSNTRKPVDPRQSRKKGLNEHNSSFEDEMGFTSRSRRSSNERSTPRDNAKAKVSPNQAKSSTPLPPWMVSNVNPEKIEEERVLSRKNKKVLGKIIRENENEVFKENVRNDPTARLAEMDKMLSRAERLAELDKQTSETGTLTTPTLNNMGEEEEDSDTPIEVIWAPPYATWNEVSDRTSRNSSSSRPSHQYPVRPPYRTESNESTRDFVPPREPSERTERLFPFSRGTGNKFNSPWK